MHTPPGHYADQKLWWFICRQKCLTCSALIGVWRMLYSQSIQNDGWLAHTHSFSVAFPHPSTADMLLSLPLSLSLSLSPLTFLTTIVYHFINKCGLVMGSMFTSPSQRPQLHVAVVMEPPPQASCPPLPSPPQVVPQSASGLGLTTKLTFWTTPCNFSNYMYVQQVSYVTFFLIFACLFYTIAHYYTSMYMYMYFEIHFTDEIY